MPCRDPVSTDRSVAQVPGRPPLSPGAGAAPHLLLVDLVVPELKEDRALGPELVQRGLHVDVILKQDVVGVTTPAERSFLRSDRVEIQDSSGYCAGSKSNPLRAPMPCRMTRQAGRPLANHKSPGVPSIPQNNTQSGIPPLQPWKTLDPSAPTCTASTDSPS